MKTILACIALLVCAQQEKKEPCPIEQQWLGEAKETQGTTARVIRTAAAWTKAWEEYGTGDKKEIPTVDFTKSLALVIVPKGTWMSLAVAAEKDSRQVTVRLTLGSKEADGYKRRFAVLVLPATPLPISVVKRVISCTGPGEDEVIESLRTTCDAVRRHAGCGDQSPCIKCAKTGDKLGPEPFCTGCAAALGVCPDCGLPKATVK